MIKKGSFQFDNSYLKLPDKFYAKLAPLPVPAPELVIFNKALATSLGLNFSTLTQEKQAALFAGNCLPEEAEPFSQAYAGHQFGHFTILGDGRAHMLGEHVTPDKKRVDIQFKGSGQTPYSRRGDGRAALGPMLREYIISEAMHHLGIPTTRSLAVVKTGELIRRETLLPGAILTRVASSHLRVGTIEFAAMQNDKQTLITLLEYSLARHYPTRQDSKNKALALIEAVMKRQAELIVHWMRVGFIHGVMNTDNMTLSGETIDYGPCAFMDTYAPDTVFSSIDHTGRYAYGNQPNIAQWNLAKLAEALLPLIDDDINKAVSRATLLIDQFPKIYQQKYLTMMRAKLGLFDALPGDEQLIIDLLDWMVKNQADYTNTFYHLGQQVKPTQENYQQKSFAEWYQRWQNRLTQNRQPLASSVHLMHKTNPAVIPRNHKVEEALKAAHANNYKPLTNLLAALKEPYKDQALLEPYQSPPPFNERVYQTFCGT